MNLSKIVRIPGTNTTPGIAKVDPLPRCQVMGSFQIWLRMTQLNFKASLALSSIPKKLLVYLSEIKHRAGKSPIVEVSKGNSPVPCLITGGSSGIAGMHGLSFCSVALHRQIGDVDRWSQYMTKLRCSSWCGTVRHVKETT